MLSGDTPQPVGYNGSGTAVTAVPSTGYHFAGWSDGVTTAARVDTGVRANIAVTALFAANPVLSTTTKLSGSSSTRVKKYYKLSGTVSPAGPGRVTIKMTRKVGRKWRSAGTVNVSVSGGSFSYRFKPRYRGSWHFVATYSGGMTAATTYWTSHSVTKSLSVR